MANNYSDLSKRFDLVPIIFDDTSLQCRPILWDDNDIPIQYMTTCPKCSQLIQFFVKDTYDDHYYCPNCGWGKETYEQYKNVHESFDRFIDKSLDEINDQSDNQSDNQSNKQYYKQPLNEIDNKLDNVKITGRSFTDDQKKIIYNMIQGVLELIDEDK